MEGRHGTLKCQSPCCQDWAPGSTVGWNACRSGPGRRCWTCNPGRSWGEGCRSHNVSGCICSTRSLCGPCWRSGVSWDGICPPRGTFSLWQETPHWTGPHRCPCPLWHDVRRRPLRFRLHHLIQKSKKQQWVKSASLRNQHILYSKDLFQHFDCWQFTALLYETSLFSSTACMVPRFVFYMHLVGFWSRSMYFRILNFLFCYSVQYF